MFGGAAALGGCILYATVVLVTGYELALMAILVGYMVGRAVRHGSRGLGGRPQQILAVALTYFGITTGYIPVFVSAAVKQQSAHTAPAAKQSAPKAAPEVTETQPEMSFGKAIVFLLLIAAAAPFLELSSGFSGLLSLFIIFIGLQRAWKMTGRTELLVVGPYEVTPAP